MSTTLHRNLLEPHPANRKHFDASRMAELHADIAARGVLDDLIVRPLPGRGSDGQPTHQILSGERRWRASEGTPAEAALPCKVVVCNDLEALELVAVPNIQREDLHPLDEATVFEQMLLEPPAWLKPTAPRLAGYSVDQLADRVHSCACLPERGTLYAARRLERHVRSATQGWQRPVYYLKLDLRNFFVSIPKAVLFEQIAARVREPFWLWLAETILFHDPRGDVEVRGRASDLALVPPHKSLFNAPPDTGLPIGNLSSQFFANIFLDALDQFVKHKVGAKHYVRYVDDFVLVHESAAWLSDAHRRIAGFLAERLGMQINERKTILQPASRGIDFVGQVIRPHHRTTRGRTLRVALHRLETMPAEQLHASGNSYLGLVRQSGTSHHEQALVCRALMKRGHTVNGALTKAYRRAA